MDHDLTGSEDNTPKCYIVYIYTFERGEGKSQVNESSVRSTVSG